MALVSCWLCKTLLKLSPSIDVDSVIVAGFFCTVCWSQYGVSSFLFHPVSHQCAIDCCIQLFHLKSHIYVPCIWNIYLRFCLCRHGIAYDTFQVIAACLSESCKLKVYILITNYVLPWDGFEHVFVPGNRHELYERNNVYVHASITTCKNNISCEAHLCNT